MNQSRLFCLIQHLHSFLFADLTGKTLLHKEFSYFTKDETHLFRFVAVSHADSAGAFGERDVIGIADEIFDLLIGMHTVLGCNRFFHSDYSHERRRLTGKRNTQRFTMILFPELAQTLVHGCSSALHEGELKHAGNQRQQTVEFLSLFILGINNAFVGH